MTRLTGAAGRNAELSPQRAEQSRKARGLLDEEIDDEDAEQDLLEVFELSGIDEVAERRSGEMVDQNRQKQDECSADKIAGDAAHPADDDDEHHLERTVEIEASRVDRAEISKSPERAGNAAIE